MTNEQNTQEKINQLQLMEQNMQNISAQKQNFQSQLSEVESALNEIESTKNVYKIIGNLMFLSDKEKMKEELSEKQNMLNIRVSTLEKQEDKLKQKAKSLQQEVLEEMKK